MPSPLDVHDRQQAAPVIRRAVAKFYDNGELSDSICGQLGEILEIAEDEDDHTYDLKWFEAIVRCHLVAEKYVRPSEIADDPDIVQDATEGTVEDLRDAVDMYTDAARTEKLSAKGKR